MKDKIIGIGLIVVIIWATVTFWIGTPWPWKLWLAKQDSTAYLEEKYGEPFTVRLPLFWIMDGTFHAEAFPTARPEIVFVVGTEQRRDGIGDNYELIRDEHTRLDEVRSILAHVFPVESMDISMHTMFGLDGRQQYDDFVYVMLTEAPSLHDVSAKLYPLISQLQTVPIYAVVIATAHKEIQLTKATQPANEEAFLALWQNVESTTHD